MPTYRAERCWESRDELESLQLIRLQSLITQTRESNPFQRNKLESVGVDAGDIQTVSDLRSLPVTTKQELVDDQLQHPPYGTNLTYSVDSYSRLHQTSGTTGRPMRWMDTTESWEWWMECWRQIYVLAGITDRDRFFFPFSFGPFVGFWAAFEGATRLRNLCIAGGGMSTDVRLRVMQEHHATVICCTPTYALRMAEVAAAEGINLRDSAVRMLIVAGEPGGAIPATRERIESLWNARVIDHWGMTEIGPLAVESHDNPGGLYVLETECIAEIVNPESLQPVDAGEAGELLLTNLGRVGSPLIRYRTRDLVQADTAADPSGRCLLRLKGGILGRSDDMVTIRGNNVFPSSLEAILREFPDVAEYRIDVHSVRSMRELTVTIEPTESAAAEADHLASTVGTELRRRLGFGCKVETAAPGSLPRFELKGRRFHRHDTDDSGPE